MRSTLVAAAVWAAVAVSAASAQALPTWGNTTIPDCSFAAAADWEVLDLGYTPDEATVEREFGEAGGGPIGIAEETFQLYWEHHGIGGVRVHIREPPGEDVLLARGPLPASAVPRLERLLDEYRVLPAYVKTSGGERHTVVLTGHDAWGVDYVTWGEERHMTWAEWLEDAEGVLAVAVQRAAPLSRAAVGARVEARVRRTRAHKSGDGP